MPQIKISDASTDRLPRPDKTIWYSDKQVPGFQVAVGPQSRTFYAVGRLSRANKIVRVKVGKHPHVSATAARREALSVLSELSQGRDPRTQRCASLGATLDAYIAYWSHPARDRLSEDTAQQYRRVLELHCSTWLDKPLDAITQHDVHRVHDRLGTKPYTANQVIRVLRQLYRFARRTDSGIDDPTSSVGFYREKERRSKLQLPDLPSWHEAVMRIANPYRRNYHLIALMTGIRRENLAEMRWEHVDLERATVFLPRTKSRRTPTLPLSTFVVERLRELAALRQNEFVFWAQSKSGHIAEPKEEALNARVHDYRKVFTSACYACLLPKYIIGLLRGDAVREDVIDEYVQDLDLRGHIEAVNNYIRKVLAGTSTTA
jgi:integrase